MIGSDTIGGIVGGRRCPWCTQKPDTWFETHLLERSPRWVFEVILVLDRVPLFRIGWAWHRFFHAKTSVYVIERYYTDDELRYEIAHQATCGCEQMTFSLGELTTEWDRRFASSDQG